MVRPVISVTHLELAPKGLDPYGRDTAEGQEPVDNVEGDTEEWKSWEPEPVVDKRRTCMGRRDNVEYLVKYRGWGIEYHEWHPVELQSEQVL